MAKEHWHNGARVTPPEPKRKRRRKRTNGKRHEDKALCHPCFKRGHEVEAVTSDDDDTGWPLCGECDEVITKARSEGKSIPGCDVNGIPLDPYHPWNTEGTRH